MFFPLHDKNNEPVKTVPYFSIAIILLNILVFGYQVLLEESGSLLEARLFTMDFALRPNDVFNNLWTLVSYAFFHASLIHIVGNLWFFWIFADNVECILGGPLFLAFYLGSGISAGILHTVFSTHTLIGASGAIAGVMGAYIVFFPKNRITCYFCPIWFYIRRLDVPAWIVLGFYLLFQAVAFLQSEILDSNVAFDCHIGGFLTGAALSWAFNKRKTGNLPGHHEGKNYQVGKNQGVQTHL